MATGGEDLQVWYLAQCSRGQQLLDGGRVGEATAVFEAVLARLGGAPGYGRAVVLGRLGRCAHLSGRPDLAVARLHDAMEVAGTLAQSDGVKGLQGTLQSELGEALRAVGDYGKARTAYEAALAIAEELQDLRAQGVDLGQLGALALAEGRPEEALVRYRAALRLFQQIQEPDLAAVVRRQLARTLGHLANVLQSQPGRLADARRLGAEALAIAQALDPAAAETWKTYGLLASLAGREAATTADRERKAALQAQARDYRQLDRHAPRILAALARVGAAPSYGRAVILGRLGLCFHMGGRPDLAVAPLREATDIAATLAPGDGVKGLQGTLQSELGEALRALGRHGEARTAYEAALAIAEELQDLRGQGVGLAQLGALALAEGKPEEALVRYRAALRLFQQIQEPALEAIARHQLGRLVEGEAERHAREAARMAAGGDPAPAFEVTVEDDLVTEYGIEPDLLLDGRRERRITRWSGEPGLVGDDLRPMLVPGARTWMDDEGAVRLGLPAGEPLLERHPACIVMRRARREVVVSGNPGLVWRLIRGMDGARTVADILSELPASDRAAGASMLAALAATGAIDASGRPIARFLHSATKKGVLPGGGLESDEVLRLAADGDYRRYPGAPRLAVETSVPERLRAFHALTRSRRSRRDYVGRALGRDELDALLHTACGVTGAAPGGEREVKLRAYASSGGLYAVEIYPVVLRVDGLEPAVYHYCPVDEVLELVRPGLERERIVAAALPVERQMVAGAAALVCLTGFFPRHERKYGEGGYRMLVAEAGHLSQNLILTAAALGLGARPFGGVFDDLLNEDLGLGGPEEQFLLGVLVGHAGA